MKKRVLSVLLVIALLVAVGIIAAQAETNYTWEEIISKSSAQRFVLEDGEEYVVAPCYACGGVDQNWYPLTEGGAMAGKHYFLANEITTTTDTYGVRNTSGKMCLHLNGYNITFTELHKPMVAIYNGGSEMNVFATGSTIQQSAYGWSTVVGYNTTNLYGGTYKNIAMDKYNLFDAKSGTMSLYNVTGTIPSGNHKGNAIVTGSATLNFVNSSVGSVKVTNGVGVANITSSNIINQASIAAFISGKAEDGAQVLNNNAVLNINGGTVPAVNATGGTVNVNGGTVTTLTAGTNSFNVYNNGTDNTTFETMTTTATVNVAGGTTTTLNVNNGTTTVTGGMITTLTPGADLTALNISGNPKIDTLALTESGPKPTFGALTSGASLGYGSYTGVISTAYATEQEAEDIAATFPVVPGTSVTVNANNELVYGAKTYTNAEIATESAKQVFTGTEPVTAFCYKCGNPVTWKPITEAAAVHEGYMAQGGHYFVANDISTDGQHAINFNNYTGRKTYCLHLNGKTLSSTNSGGTGICVWTDQQTVNIMGNGYVQNKAGLWGALHAAAATTVNVYGGTYGRTASSDQNRAINIVNNATVNIYYAQVTSADSNPERGKLDVQGGTANIYDGEFTCVRTNGTGAFANVYGGTINKFLANSGTADISNTTITTMDAKGATVTVNANVGTMTVSNGSVTVNGGTVPTINASAGAVTVNGGTVNTLTSTGAAATVNASVGTVNASAGSLTLAKAPVIGNLTTSLVVDAKGLTGGQITLGTVDGVFTTAFDSKVQAEAAKAYFVLAAGMQIKITDANELNYTALSCDTPADIIAFANNEMPKVAGFAGTEAFSAFCPHCNKSVTWTALGETGGIGFGSAHYFLTVDRAGIYCDSHQDNGGSVLYLNGKTVSGNIGCGELRKLDILGNGTVTGINTAALTGSGTFTVYGGTYGSNSTSATACSISTTGTTNFYGGTITKAKAYAVMTNDGNFTIYGGEVQGPIYLDNNGKTGATVTVEGGNFTDANIGNGRGTVTINGGTFTNPEIGVGGSEEKMTYLNLNGGTFIGEATLNNHASVGIVTFGADFDQTVTVNIGKLNEENGSYGRTEALYKATTGGLKATVYGEDVDNKTYGLVYDSAANDGSLIIAKTAIVNGETTTWYENNAAAVEAFNGTGCIKLFTLDALAIDKNIALDLNGKKVDVTGNGTITGIDTYTKGGFGRQPGALIVAEDANIDYAAPAVTEDAETKVISGYLPVKDLGEITFTYFEMKLSGVALKANTQSVGLYYKGTWSFNAYLPAGKVEAGVVVNVKDQDEAAIETVTGNSANGYFSKDAKDVVNGQPLTSVLVNDIMKSTGRDAAINEQYGQMKIKAAAFIIVNDQEILTGTKNLSVCDVLKLIEGNDEQYAANETKLANFYNTWNTLANLDAWGLTKIGKEN